MAFDFKTATPATSIIATELLFGAVSQVAANPSIYPASVLKTFMSLNPTITDANSKTALTFAAIASAVNYFEMENAATGGALRLYARGTDTDVGIHLVPKGAGFINIQDAADATKRIRFNPAGNSASAITTIASSDTASHTLTLPNATTTLAGLAVAQTFTQNQTITEVAGGSGLTITGATQTTSQPVLNLTQTWNAGAITFSGLKLNVTDTASASGSLLIDLQVGGVSKFSVDKTGIGIFATHVQIGTSANQKIYFPGVNTMGFTVGGVTILQLGTNIWENPAWLAAGWTIGSTSNESGNTNRAGSPIKIIPKGGSGNGTAPYVSLWAAPLLKPLVRPGRPPRKASV